MRKYFPAHMSSILSHLLTSLNSEQKIKTIETMPLNTCAYRHTEQGDGTNHLFLKRQRLASRDTTLQYSVNLLRRGESQVFLSLKKGASKVTSSRRTVDERGRWGRGRAAPRPPGSSSW